MTPFFGMISLFPFAYKIKMRYDRAIFFQNLLLILGKTISTIFGNKYL